MADGMAVVEHCTVHNSIVQMPEVRITAEAAIGSPSR